LPDKFAEPWLRDRCSALVDLVDDILSDIDTYYGPPTVGHHGTDYRTDVAEAHDSDPGPHATDQEVDLTIALSERASNHRRY
jgi:hypothetical protein